MGPRKTHPGGPRAVAPATARSASSRRGSDLIAIAAALVVLALFAAVAFGQAPAPTLTPPDTEATPTPADGVGLFTHVGGADFGEKTVDAKSATPIDVNFLTVRFFSAREGFAAGTACRDHTTDYDKLDTCDRVPVIWHYTEPDGEKPRWEEVYRGDTKGYVGGIAYLDPERVIAVGGTGSYPDREVDAGQPDPAGKARAWLWEGGTWHEIQDLPKEMTGLTALDVSPRPEDCGADAVECGFAGGWKQLWRWRDGDFDRAPVLPSSTPDPENHASQFSFRVRELRFGPGDKPIVRAMGVTSGCCADNPADNVARILLYDGKVWRVRNLFYDSSGQDHAETLPDSYYASVTRDGDGGIFASVLATTGHPVQTVNGQVVEPTSRIVGHVTVADETGGTPFPDELRPQGYATQAVGAVLAPPSDRSGDLPTEAGNPLVADLHLVAADGDVASSAPNLGQRAGSGVSKGPDDYFDWAVGSFSSGQGAVYTTLNRPQGAASAPLPLTCPADQLGPTCTPNAAGDPMKALASHSLFKLPTYRLNAFTFADSSASVGWAVGDKGALVRLGGDATGFAATDEPSAPDLGTAEDSPLPDDSPYAAFRPFKLSARPGALPPLASRPVRHLATPDLEPAGSPDPTRKKSTVPESVATVVMSRDGTEGWALGSSHPSDGTTTVYHYSDGRWSRCETDPVPGQLPADPACESLRQLRVATYGDTERPVNFTAAIRVPLERDDDPSNDDEFEVFALGTSMDIGDGSQRPVVARYRDGRWMVDKVAMKSWSAAGTVNMRQVAAATPDDIWVMSDVNELYRLRNDRWTDCQSLTDQEAAENSCNIRPGSLLPTGQGKAVDGYQLASAGNRVYVAGTRKLNGVAGVTVQTGSTAVQTAPFVLYLDEGKPCQKEGDPGCWRADDGGYDPSASCPNTAEASGQLTAFSVAQNGDGSYSGWAVGSFGGTGVDTGNVAPLLHLEKGTQGCGSGSMRWVPWRHGDAADDYLLTSSTTSPSTRSPGRTPVLGQTVLFRAVTVPSDSGEGVSFIAPWKNDAPAGPILRFDPGKRAWATLQTPFTLAQSGDVDNAFTAASAAFDAMAPDQGDGLWMAVRPPINLGNADGGIQYESPTFFYHYVTEAHEPVFDDVENPVRERITATAAGGDGSFWVATASSVVYRYDRLTGWNRVAVRGWNAGRLVTKAASADAIAVGPDGHGVVVGEGGRVANIGPGGALLDAVAGVSCATGAAKCGTTRTLRAAAIAPDGSAMVAGDDRAVLLRRPGGDFQPITPPGAALSATFTSVSFPAPTRAWLTTDSGQVFAGTDTGGDWRWRLENVSASAGHATLSAGRDDRTLPLRGIAVGDDGTGYAVGADGLLLRRTGDGAYPWRRLNTGMHDDLFSVALAPDGNSAAVGGAFGLVLTGSGDRFEISRPADVYDPVTAGFANFPGRIVGLALLPGEKDGQLEAWAAEQVPYVDSAATYNRNPPPNALLHYTSDPDDPLLSPQRRVEPLPDAPLPRPGELTFAAFGKSDCHIASNGTCPELGGTNLQNDVVARRISEDIIARSKRSGGPAFALFTGDGGDSAGKGAMGDQNDVGTPVDDSTVHRRWADLVADRLRDGGVPLFGTIGAQDLAQARVCQNGAGCVSRADAPVALSWRTALAGMPAPWGDGPAPKEDGVSFDPVAQSGTEAPGGGARTHYALDIKRDGGASFRLVTVDTSEGSLAQSEQQQNPVESQTSWLKTALDRPAGEPAIVLTNRPTFSYGPAATTDLQTGGNVFESLMSTSDVSAVVTGRLGWNALYYSFGAGLHCPGPGGSYPTGAPVRPDQCEGGDDPLAQVSAATGQAADSLQALGAPPPPDPVGLANNALVPTPYVVASGGGGKFGPNGEEEANTGPGYWYGYSIVRVAKSGDPRQTIVEQRPVIDWLDISGNGRSISAGQRVKLTGTGRQPAGTDQPLRYVTFNDPSTTHRWDLIQADPKRPYLPRRDADGHYVPLDTSVGSIDMVTGQVKAGRGRQDTTYAIALLSVGDKAASYPLVFLPSKSFTPSPPATITNTAAFRSVAPPQTPAVRVLGTTPASLPPSAPPPAGAPPVNANVTLPPPPPVPPAVPPVATPTPSPPPPPAPPPPPPPSAPIPMSIAPKLGNISIQATVLPPTPPPVNPAPPSGGAARKEAKQRQAAVAKSESASEGSEGQAGEAHGRIDAVDSPNASMTRHEERAHFTAIVHRDQPSAWARGALYGGSLTLMALTLALGFTSVRPRSRRRPPEAPAPAWARRR